MQECIIYIDLHIELHLLHVFLFGFRVCAWIGKMARQSQEVQVVEAHAASLEWVWDHLWHVYNDSTDILLTQFDLIRIAIEHRKWIDTLIAIVCACRMFVVYVVASIFGFGSMALISGCTVIWCTTLNMVRVGNTLFEQLISIPSHGRATTGGNAEGP